MVDKERRKAARTKADIPITLRAVDSAGTAGQVMTLDISMSGLQLRSETPIEVGSSIALHFPKEWQGLTLIADVVRRDGDRFGCVFKNAGPMELEALDRTLWLATIKNLAAQVRDEPDLSLMAGESEIVRRIRFLEHELEILKQSATYLSRHKHREQHSENY
jgi:hypothetical protein